VTYDALRTAAATVSLESGITFRDIFHDVAIGGEGRSVAQAPLATIHYIMKYITKCDSGLHSKFPIATAGRRT
jgi:hypothetical protein